MMFSCMLEPTSACFSLSDVKAKENIDITSYAYSGVEMCRPLQCFHCARFRLCTRVFSSFEIRFPFCCTGAVSECRMVETWSLCVYLRRLSIVAVAFYVDTTVEVAL